MLPCYFVLYNHPACKQAPLHRRGTVVVPTIFARSTVPLLWRGGCVAVGVVFHYHFVRIVILSRFSRLSGLLFLRSLRNPLRPLRLKTILFNLFNLSNLGSYKICRGVLNTPFFNILKGVCHTPLQQNSNLLPQARNRYFQGLTIFCDCSPSDIIPIFL